jgi:hypothetical protein
MAVNPAGDTLPCGRYGGQLWDSLSESPPDQHTRSCPHCQAVLATIRPVAAAISQLAAEPVSPPADLASNVMSAIRARTHRNHRIPLPAPAGMRLDIREQAATAILRAAADRIDGVRARSCQLIRAAGRESPTGAQLTISVRYGTPADQRAALVRAAVRAAARSQLGLALDTINITVTDIYDSQ